MVREENINGDREMVLSFFMVGFDVADVTVTDIKKGKIKYFIHLLIYSFNYSLKQIIIIGH